MLIVPAGSCDCHLPIYDSRVALAPNVRRTEADAPVSEYRKVQRRLGLLRVVVVQSAAYGRDNSCTLQAIADLGDLGNSARGVAVIDDTASDAEIERLHNACITPACAACVFACWSRRNYREICSSRWRRVSRNQP